MPLNVFWFIPTQGDGRFLGTTVGARPATYDYFSQVAAPPIPSATKAFCCLPAEVAMMPG
jgi:hypothetical protein